MTIIKIPTICPCCEYPLQLVNSQLFCRNTACSAQIGKKIEHFAKTLKIKGLGPANIKKLNLEDITELYFLDYYDTCEALKSEAVGTKLMTEIDKSRSSDLATVLEAMSIPLIGGTASTKIASVVSHIREITREKCKEAGLGDKASSNLLTWIETDFQELKEFLPFSWQSTLVKSTNTDVKSVCITGKLKSYKTKSEATKLLQAAGFIVSETVTKSLNYLVDEESKDSTKRKKAESLGITIITNLNDLLTKKEV